MDYLKQAEKALEYLAESEEEWARYKGLLKFQSDRLKSRLAIEMTKSVETTEAGKKRDAEASEAFEQLIDECIDISVDFYTLDAKRKRAELTIDMFRSVNSGLKRGNV